MLGKKGSMGKVLHRVVQGLGKGLDEGAAAGGTGFVKQYAVYGLILDADTFHILTADIQDTVYLRIKEGSSIVVGDGLHFSVIQQKGSF